MDIFRVNGNNGFRYVNSDGREVTNNETINRISRNHIPPNWIDVKISSDPTSYLQVVGVDSRGRKQYLYHPLWKEMVKNEKFSRLALFAEKLPKFKKSVNNILSGSFDSTNKECLVALILRLLEKTHSRIGNEIYKEGNNTYGLTTLLKKHVRLEGQCIIIEYVGKKSILQSFMVNDSVSSKAILELMNIPGENLFKTSGGHVIRSSDINAFIKKNMGEDFTSKDYRTYATNALLLKILYKSRPPEGASEARETLSSCCNRVAKILGHTKQVSKSSYICPTILSEYNKNPNLFVKKKTPLELLLKK